jgi:phosphatidylethanolamine/phosphatidyl-N-methylethanolamine N-methyltransferase
MPLTNMDLTTFAMEAVADFRTIGAVAPSSRFLTEAMLKPLPLARARLVVEVGSGTGAMTQSLLNLIPSDATLLAFEINSRFSRYLKSNVPDARLDVINASAETLRKEVRRRGYDRVDAVVSSLALGFMPDRTRRTFLGQLGSLLGDQGVFTQFQYLHSMQLKNGQVKRFDLLELLHQYFHSVQRRVIWRNLPPAFVFVCRGPLYPEKTRPMPSDTQPSRKAKRRELRRGFAGPKSS